MREAFAAPLHELETLMPASHLNRTLCAIALLAVLLAGIGMSGITRAYGQEAPVLRPGIDVALGPDGHPLPDGAENTAPPVQPHQTGLAPLPPALPPLPEQPVRRRAETRDQYVPLGIPAGAFRIFPELRIDGVVTDNVDQTKHGKVADTGLRIAPSIRLQSNWVRHSLTFSAAGEHIFYNKTPEQNDTGIDVNTALRLDIRRRTNLELTAAYALDQTPSSNSQVPNAAVGKRSDHEASFTSALTHRFNRLTATVRAEARWLIFGDVALQGGGKENNADRDYVEPRLALRLGYEVSPAVQPFVELAYNPRIHRLRVDRSGLRRNSHGFSATAGIVFNESEIWSGDIAVVFQARTFRDSALDDIISVGVAGNIVWRPSQLTTVTFNSASTIDETATAGQAGIRTYTAGLNVAHTLRQNITLSAGLGIEYEDIIGTSQDDLTFSARLGLSYILNRDMELTGGYRFTRQKSGTPGDGYTENRLTVGVRFRL